MLELIKSDLKRYDNENEKLLHSLIKAAYTHPAFIGLVWYRIGHSLWQKRNNPIFFFLLTIHRIFYPLVRIHSGLELSPRTEIGPGLYIAHFGPTVIHPDTRAGSNLTLLQGVTIGAHNTGVPVIGNSVAIATGAKVIGGITIGNNVTIGAGAVVVKDVPDDCTVVGIPAKPVWSKEEIHAVKLELPKKN
jgi:serine O-acetyltransferase